MSRAPKVCKRCGVPPRAGEALTHRGYHLGCAMAVADEAADEMREKRGPRYEAFLRSAGAHGPPRGGRGGSPLQELELSWLA